MAGLEDLTEEELAELQEYVLMQRAQNDPLALSANAYGQGPGFLGLEDRPDSWSRLGDKNQIYRDMFQMTGTDMAEYVPGLYDYVPQPKPGDLEGYQSDTASLYAGNPVYQEIERQVANGVDIDTAVNAIRSAYEQDPEALQGSLPMGNPQYGRAEPDWEAVNRNAATFLSERNKETAAQSEAEAIRQAYEDFTAPRTAYDKAAETQDLSWEANRDATMRMMGYDPRERAPSPVSMPDVVDMPVVGERGPTRSIVQADRDAINYAQQYSSPQRNARGGTRATRGYTGGTERRLVAPKDLQRKGPPQRELNAMSSWDAAARIAKSKNVGSKKEENLAKLTAFYNTLMYGQ